MTIEKVITFLDIFFDNVGCWGKITPICLRFCLDVQLHVMGLY